MLEIRKLDKHELSAAEDIIEATGAFHRPELADLGGIVWGAFQDEKLIGCVWLGVLSKLAILDYLAVLPEHQRKGVAKKLLLSAEEDLMVSGVKKVQFLCHVSNMPSITMSLSHSPAFSGPFVNGVVELGVRNGWD